MSGPGPGLEAPAARPVPPVAAPSPAWRSEPFRLFFPLGILIGWAGVGHWLLYAAGAVETYSCIRHGLIQLQAFLMSFALGFLLTALPRRTASAQASPFELGAALVLVVTTAFALLADLRILAEVAYLALFALLLRFALSRLLAGNGAQRRPPPSFALVPVGVSAGILGALLLIAGSVVTAPWALGLGQLFIEQGVFLCFALGVLPLLWPLISGGAASPPLDLDLLPHGRRQAALYVVGGVAILATLVAEALGSSRAAPLVRAAIVALAVGLGAGGRYAPVRPGLHRRLVWLSGWLMPVGLAMAGIWPDYRVPALHVLFIGGFSLMALAVATHVAVSHLDLPHAAMGRPPAVVVLGVGMLLALLARLAADLSDTYFLHLGWAAGVWIVATGVWLAWLGPRLLGWRRARRGV